MAAAPRPTQRRLALRLRVLLLLAALATAALYGSYLGVHEDAGPARSADAPALLALDTAADALTRAQDAGDSRESEFRQQTSVAAESIASASADIGTAGDDRQTLQTAAALLTVYSSMVQQAREQRDTTAVRPGSGHPCTGGNPCPLLASAYDRYAADVLGDIRGDLAAVRRGRARELARRADFGAPLWAGWSVAAAAGLALLGGLAETDRYLRRTFRRRINRPLLAATALLLAGGTAAAALTADTHGALAAARDRLAAPLAGTRIRAAADAVAAPLAGTGWREAAAVWIPVGGVFLMVLIGAVFWPRIREYRFEET